VASPSGVRGLDTRSVPPGPMGRSFLWPVCALALARGFILRDQPLLLNSRRANSALDAEPNTRCLNATLDSAAARATTTTGTESPPGLPRFLACWRMADLIVVLRRIPAGVSGAPHDELNGQRGQYAGAVRSSRAAALSRIRLALVFPFRAPHHPSRAYRRRYGRVHVPGLPSCWWAASPLSRFSHTRGFPICHRNSTICHRYPPPLSAMITRGCSSPLHGKAEHWASPPTFQTLTSSFSNC